MGKLFAAAITLACLGAHPLAGLAREAQEEPRFQLPEVVSVSDVTIPILSIASGTVVLDVMISEEGEVRNVQVRRDIASETEVAIGAVKTWKFDPAKLNGKAVASRMTVAVTFNPTPPQAGDNPLPPLIHQDDEARIQSSYEPAQVTRAVFPRFPDLALSPGAAIFEVNIDEAGKARSTKVLRDAPPFTAAATRVIGDWRFMPATLDGRKIESKAVLVFCFRLPVSNGR